MSVAPLSSAYGKAESCKPAGRAHWIGKVELDTRHQTTVQGQSKKQNKDGQSLASLFCSPHAGVSSVPPDGGQLSRPSYPGWSIPDMARN